MGRFAGYWSVDFRLKTFAAEACGRLAFLVSEHGFTGSEVEHSKQGIPQINVRYSRDDAAVETSLVLYYMGEDVIGSGSSTIAALVDERPPRRATGPQALSQVQLT